MENRNIYEHKRGSAWDRMSPPVRWGLVILLAVYFGAGIIAPLFWRF